jgi:hypothetical protein
MFSHGTLHPATKFREEPKKAKSTTVLREFLK